MNNIIKQYFIDNPDAFDEVKRASYAYHIPHYRVFPQAHNFLGGDRKSKCSFCGYSREEIRWDMSIPFRCQSVPPSAHDSIQDVLTRETLRTFEWSKNANKIITKYLEKQPLNGKNLAYIHETYGYSPTDVEDAISIKINNEIFKEYEEYRKIQSQKGLDGFKPKTIEIKHENSN